MEPPALRCVLNRPQRSLDRVVVCDRDHIQVRPACGMLHQLRRCRPAVAGCGVRMEVCPTPTNHGCASYPRQAYHRLFHS
jgi:hypothetical protein